MIVNNTPLELHNGILVKREDLCCPLPGPCFSKMRGVVSHIANRPEKVIGVLDTLHSKAGWAVSYACQQLGKQAVNFWPRYNADAPDGLVRQQQQTAFDMGANMIALKAGRSAILFHEANKVLRSLYPGSYMMPNALKLDESVTENAAEAVRTAEKLPDTGTLVISISSGTVAAGVIKGFIQAGKFDGYKIMLHMGYDRSIEAVQSYIEYHVGQKLPNLLYVNEHYGYADTAPAKASAPFPCNPHYDLKAWHWLGQLPRVTEDYVFWNIGS